MSLGGCLATLAGNPARQYPSASASSALSVVYDVSANLTTGTCRDFVFTVIEEGAEGQDLSSSFDFASGISFIVLKPNADGDSVFDDMDVDLDGDGLIEISTVAQLNMMRNNLAGTGLDADNSDGNLYAGGDDTGCGGGTYANGTVITTCNGYELMADIDLNDLPKSDTSMVATGSGLAFVLLV